MNTVTIIQARMASTRLPGKTLKHIGDKTTLEWIIYRLNQTTEPIGPIIVATGARGDDNPIQQLCQRRQIGCHRGASHNVLHRYYTTLLTHTAVQEHEPTHILRVTADCPLLDPRLVDQLIRNAAGDITRIEPSVKGIGEEELITTQALIRLHRETTDPSHAEHVTGHAEHNPRYTITTDRKSVV